MEYTIESLAAELGITRPALKDILELQSTMPNNTVLTEEEIEKVKANAEPTVKPTPAAKSPAKKDEVVFCWPKMKKPSFSIGQRAPDGKVLPAIRRQAVNGVLRLSRSNKEDAVVIAHLKKHGGNQANGGTRFSEFKGSIAPNSTETGTRIQELMTMPARTLTQLTADKLDGDLIGAQVMSAGDQIALVLGLKNAE